MEAILTGIFIITLLAVGVSYLRFCKTVSEDLINNIKFRQAAETEGGDNWPDIQLDMMTLDFLLEDNGEKNREDVGKTKMEFCGQK